MRTTLDIDDELLQRARHAAVRERISLTRFIEESLSARFIKESLNTARRHDEEKSALLDSLPVFAGQGGLQASIRDPRSLESVLDAIDEADA